MNNSHQQSDQPGWLALFLKELVSMPRKHIVVFLIFTVLLVLLEIEVTEGWHLTHIVEVVGAMLLFYLSWAFWRCTQKKDGRGSLL
ncbi:MAG TPA: hypothetical protein PKK23_21095 [Nitrospirales bacterium]|nr:hypothetical protein [Nitrospiraceae bacterium]HNP31556.1 hypothetical protein [Nitrospirales bacterium]